MFGSPGFGNAHPTRELTGAIRTTIIINAAGRCMRATGTMKTTAIIMIAITIVANLEQSGFAKRRAPRRALFFASMHN